MNLDPLAVSIAAVAITAISAVLNWRRDDRKERRELAADFDRRLLKAEGELRQCQQDKATVQQLLDLAERRETEILRRLYTLEGGKGV